MLSIAAMAIATAMPLETPAVSVWIDDDGAFYLAPGAALERPVRPTSALASALAGVQGAGARVRVHLDPSTPMSAFQSLRDVAANAGLFEIDIVTDGTNDGLSLMPMGWSWPPPAADPASTEPAPVAAPPLTLTWWKEGLFVNRTADDGLPVRAAIPDVRAAAAVQALTLDVVTWGGVPGPRTVVLNVDPDEPAEGVLPALSTAARLGYYWPMLVVRAEAGANSLAWPVQRSRPKLPPAVPAAVSQPTPGQLVADGVPIDDIAWFAEDCERDPCVLVAVPSEGTPLVVGTRQRPRGPMERWILARPVWPIPGYTDKISTLPRQDVGALGPLIGGPEVPKTAPPLAPPPDYRPVAPGEPVAPVEELPAPEP